MLLSVTTPNCSECCSSDLLLEICMRVGLAGQLGTFVANLQKCGHFKTVIEIKVLTKPFIAIYENSYIITRNVLLINCSMSMLKIHLNYKIRFNSTIAFISFYFYVKLRVRFVVPTMK